jgi:hypothetical protein
MASLEDLFTLGTISNNAEVKGVNFTVNLLNTRALQDALNASSQTDETSQALEYKKQILARAISHIGEEKYIKDVEAPETAEINSLLLILNKLHFKVLNKIYDAYENLEKQIGEEMGENTLKK